MRGGRSRRPRCFAFRAGRGQAMTETVAFATLFSPIDIRGTRFRVRTTFALKFPRIQAADWRLCEICRAWRGEGSLSASSFSSRPNDGGVR